MDNNNPSKEERDRMVDDALRQFKQEQKLPEKDHWLTLIDKGKAFHVVILKAAQDILKENPLSPREALHASVLKMYLDEFSRWDKEEVLLLCAHLHAANIMELVG